MGLWVVCEKEQQTTLSLIRTVQFCSESHVVWKSLQYEILRIFIPTLCGRTGGLSLWHADSLEVERRGAGWRMHMQ